MAERRSPVTAPELLLKIVLTGTQSHYESRGLIDEKRLDHLLHAGKQILYKSHQESDVRQNLGFSPAVWEGLTLTLNRAIPVLEQQSFAWKSVSAQHYNGSSSDLIAANYFSLVKDIERLNDLCTIARNLLATTRKAQNLAADKAFDQQILKLIDVCVRVTARGFDGETNPRNEERWQKVVNLYKRLLITCLQFLHNFIMHNEQRKLVLWLDLFGTTSAAAQQAQQTEIQAVSDHINLDHRLSAQQDADYPDGDTHTDQDQSISSNTLADDRAREVDLAAKLQEISNLDLSYNLEDVHALFDLMSADRVLDAAGQEKKKLLMDRIRSDLERISRTTATQLDGDPENLLQVGAKLRELLSVRSAESGRSVLGGSASGVSNVNRNPLSALPELASYANLTSQEQPITEEDLIMPRTSLSAADTLQEAKDELMARLQDNQPMLDENGKQIYEDELVSQDVLDNDGILDSADESVEEDDEDDDEEDYRSPGDQERGLLTDVPLVLGPTEIEALPMIIQAGIVDNFGVKNGADRQGVRNMQAVRCHILLAQEAGRNVLRELLIFIAAWDLPDDEFYFKMMVQIMESILKNGLMSHAYSDFGQAKDIISPAQAVVIKILTHIFRTKYSPSASQNGNEQGPPKPRTPAPLSRVDVLTVRYIFTVFRGNIIPETCALIYLQGQIKSGLAVAEDFPLNLWDMERVYEGVYQFLEFFAVLTENNDWKRLLIEWEIVYDLVTLIKELDISISKAMLTTTMPPPGKPGKSTARQSSGASSAYARETAINARAAASNLPVSIERPYDPTASPELHPDMQPPPPPPPPQDDSKPLPPATTEDPSLFEWRNLKKLIILVLSSLVWKSPLVQDQIREHGGVDTVLSCTQYDGHNPYIKEHAVMCLKFLLEGNKENQAIVRELEARGVANGPDLERDFGVKPEHIQASMKHPQRRQQPQAQGQAQDIPPPVPFTAGISNTTSTFPKPSQISRATVDATTATGTAPVSFRRSSDSATPSFLDIGTTSTDRIANMAERFNRLDINNLNAMNAGSARLTPSQQAQAQAHAQQTAQMGYIVDESDGEGDFDEVEGGKMEFEKSENGGRFRDVGEMM